MTRADPVSSRLDAEKPWATVDVRAPECGANVFRADAFLHLLDVELLSEHMRTAKDDRSARDVELTVTIDGAICNTASRDLAIRLRWGDTDTELKRFIDLGDVALGSRERALALAVAEQIGQTRMNGRRVVRSDAFDSEDSSTPPSTARVSNGTTADEPTSREPSPEVGPDLAAQGIWRVFFSPQTSLLGADVALSIPVASTWFRLRTDLTGLFAAFTDQLGNADLSYLAVGGAALAATSGNPTFMVGPRIEVGRATVSGRAGTIPATATDGSHPVFLVSALGQMRFSIDAHWSAVVGVEMGGSALGLKVLADERALGGLDGAFATVSLGATFSF